MQNMKLTATVQKSIHLQAAITQGEGRSDHRPQGECSFSLPTWVNPMTNSGEI